MKFENANLLYALWLLVPLVLFMAWGERRRKRQLRKFAGQEVLGEINQEDCVPRRWKKNILLAGVFVLSVLALARPQWGFQWQEVKHQAVDIILLVDTSKSMLTADVKPNRLARTKLAIRDLIRKLRGDRLGIIAFAGDAFFVCPLTVDYDGVLLSLDDVSPATVPRGGTNLEQALLTALKGYKDVPSKYKAVVVLTDGDNLEGDPLAAARKAKEQGVKIFTVGIGTRQGELIQVEDEEGKQVFLKDAEGNFVKSSLNEKLLQEIALATGGIYVRQSGAQFGLDLIYDQQISKLKKREIETKREKRYNERFQWPLGLALVLLFLEVCLPVRRKKR